MFKNVIVGVDEPAASRDAIALAKALTAKHGRLTLVHVNVMYPVYAKGFLGDIEVEERADQHRLLNELAAETGVGPRFIVDAHSVGQGLHDAAEDEHADLLVVGSTRRGIVGRVVLGDDTRDSLTGAPCAVAIAPAAFADAPNAFSKVGVAYNNTDEAEHALDIARQIAGYSMAELSVCEVVSMPAVVYAQALVPYREISREMVASAQADLDKLDGVTARAVFGDPCDEMTAFSGSVDLLIVGSRALGPVGRLTHSSMSKHLSRSAQCPLLVLPRGTRRPTPSARHENPEPDLVHGTIGFIDLKD